MDRVLGFLLSPLLQKYLQAGLSAGRTQSVGVRIIIDKEKELIIKALKKHRGKRRDAAMDLGISERTLYRKLKEYDIEHL